MDEKSKDPIEEYIERKAREEFEKVMKGEREADNHTLLLMVMSRLFYRADEIREGMEKGFERMKKGMEEGFKEIRNTIKYSMYPIWISIIIGIIVYIIINVFGI